MMICTESLRGLWALAAIALAVGLLSYVGEAAAQIPTEAEPAFQLQLGVFDGPPEYTFGRIADVVADRNGRLYVLETGNRLSMYSAEGRFIQAIGRAGQGPAEFRETTDIAVDDSDRLHVLDPGNGRISIFDVSGETAEYSDMKTALPSASHLCLAGARTFVLTWRGEHLIHEIDETGRPVRSFGGPVEPDPVLGRRIAGDGTLLRAILSQGHIRCDSGGERLLYVSRYGEVRLYRLDGRLVWATQLSNFFGPEMRASSQYGCCIFGPNPERGTTEEVLASVFLSERIVISIEEYGAQPRGGGPPVRRFQIRALRASDGAELSSDNSSAIITDVHGDRMIGFRLEPFPVVVAW